MPQTWDEHGNVISAPPQTGQAWDEHGNPIGASAPSSNRIRIDLNPTFNPSKQAQAQPAAAPADTSGFLGTLGKDIWQSTAPLHQSPFQSLANTPGSGNAQFVKVGDPTQAAASALAQREAGGQSAARAIPEGIAESAFGGNMQGFDQAMKSGNYPQALAHALVPTANAAAIFGGQSEAGTAEEFKPSVSTAQLKASVADAAYKRGLGVAENLKAASGQIDDAVAQSAQRFISKVDEKFPNGAIDPKPITDAVTKLKADIVKTPERYPPALAQLLEPPAKTSTGPRIMGGHLDLSDPAQLASYQKMKAQGAFTPQEIARMEGGGTEGMWSADEAKQWRTKIGQAIGKVQGPMKSVMTEAYDNLTQQLRKAADDSDALKDFQDYNNLHKKHMAFLNDPVVSKIMDGTTSKEMLGPLADPEKQAHLQNMLADWDKYGIDTKELSKEGTDYGKAQAIMQKRGFKWFPWGTIGGGVGGRLLGIGYIPGAALGLAAERLLSPEGKAARFVESSKTSPFYPAGAAKAADIARGWSEGLPDISSRKVALKQAEGK